MPLLLPLLDVVFVGLVGKDPGHIDRQILAAETRLKVKKVALADAKSLAANDDSSADAARKLDADGVVVGQVVTQGRHRSLRLVIYNGAGEMKSMSEVPLAGTGRKLSADDIAVLKSNLGDEVSALLAPKTAPAAAIARNPTRSGSILDDSSATTSGDDDPLGDHKPAAKPPAAKPATTATATADDVPDDATTVKATVDTHATTTTPSGTERISAAAGLGLVSRSFAPGPATVRGYVSSAITEMRVDAAAHPFDHATLAFSYEHTLGMGTVLEGDTTNQAIGTNLSRWDATAAYAVIHGSLDLAPVIGVGARDFNVETNIADRSPDASYIYAVLGGVATYPAGAKLRLQAYVDFQPVLGGAEPTIALVGASSRYGLEVGASIEYRPTSLLFLRAAADYQRIEWSWNQTATLMPGTATDSYPTGSLVLGARY